MSTLSTEKSTMDILLNEKDWTLKRSPPSIATEGNYESRLNSPTIYSFRNDIVDEDSVFIDRITTNKDQDTMYIAPWRQNVARFFFITSLVPQFLSFWASRIQLRTLYHFGNEGSLSFGRLLLAWAVVLWEVVLTVDCILHVLIKFGALTGRWQPHLRLLGDNVPSVDVIVTVCNEQIDIVKDTVRAALSVDYPINRFRVIVADDGRSKLLEDWVHQFSVDHPNLYYTARTRLGGWKAGNLNEAIKFAGFLPGGAAELVAGLDADMIPEPRWLRCVAAHIMRDRKIGVVCPAQHFYNAPSDDPLFQSNKFSWYNRDLVCGLAGSGFNLGSGWVMRREAIDDIGGFPTDVLTEDITSSMMTMAEGWKTTYLPEALQWGLVPDTYAAHIKQVVRWYIGGCQMAIKFGFFLLPSRTKRQTRSQILVGFAQGLSVHLRTQMATLSLALAATVSMTNTDLVYWRDIGEMRMLLRIHCGIVLFRWLHDVHLAVLSGYRAAIWESAHSIYLAPYGTAAWFRSFILPKSLGGKTTTFTPTGSIGNVYHERDPGRRAPLLKRLQHIILGCGAWVHLLIVVSFGMGAYLRFSRALREHSLATHDKDRFEMLCVQLLRKVAWPTHPWIPTALACFTPIKYAIFPPQIPERQKLLGKRGKNGARYPVPEVMGKVKRTPFAIGFVELYTLFVVYVAVVFVATWWVDISTLK